MTQTPEDPTEFRFTKRQQEILVLMAQGNGYKEIADCMFLSSRTVERDVARVAKALGVSSHVAIGAIAYAEGLLRDEHLKSDSDACHTSASGGRRYPDMMSRDAVNFGWEPCGPDIESGR